MAQIFDCPAVTSLVMEWQSTHDVSILSDIMDGSKHLVEAIVSSYDSTQRDDLMQEAFLKIQHAIQYYNPEISNLHTYLTTVIRNTCASWLSKQASYGETTDDDIMEEIAITGDTCKESEDDEVLLDLIIRNRNRFPSIEVGDLDDMTADIYHGIMYDGNKLRKIVPQVSQRINYNPYIVGIIYNSTLAYMRYKFMNRIQVIDYSDEFNVLPDLLEVLGPKAYSRLVSVFSGMTIKLSGG